MAKNKMKILSYSYDESRPLVSNTKLGNLGDAIQTLAVIEFFKQKNIKHSGFVDRNNLIDGMFINGWHRYAHEKLPNNAIFCSIHTDKDHLAGVNKKCIIGCRDSWTHNIAQDMGFQSVVTGCVTINFPLSTSKNRNDILYIDSSHSDKNQYTQFINASTSWLDQLDMATKRLNLLSGAALVYTTRLHILIPCIAMGVPVILDEIPTSKFNEERFSYIKDFVMAGKPIELDSGAREELLAEWCKNTKYLDDLIGI